MKKEIYIYKDNNVGQWKVGKADENVGVNYTDDIGVSDNRIKNQQTAAVRGKIQVVNKFDISHYKGKSTDVESACHKALRVGGFEPVLREVYNMEGTRILKGDTEWFEFTRDSIDKVVKEQKITEEEVLEKAQIEVINTCADVIKKMTGETGLNKFSPRAYQAHVKAETLVAINSGAEVIGCELAARFGKTLWALDLFKTLCEENDKQFMVLPAFVLNAHTSFEKEIAMFEDFKDFVFVNGPEDIDLSKRLVIPASLHVDADAGKYDWIADLDRDKKVAFIDEADFGAHTESSKVVIDKLDVGTKILMTGTAIERAVAGYDVDAFIKWSYFDMLLLKDNSHPILDSMSKEERAAAVASCAEIIRPSFYKPVLNGAAQIQEQLPNVLQTKWSKMLEDVDRSAPILDMILKAMFKNEVGSNHELGSLMLSAATPAQVTMLFGSFKNNRQQEKFKKVAQTALGKNFIVFKINGDETNNRKAEHDVKEVVAKAQREGKRVLLVSRNMACRSFSIPEIDTVFLMYDHGSLSQTVQKVSRALTPGKTFNGKEKTKGAVVSLSLDSNREEIDPIDLYVVAEAERISDGKESLQKSIRRVCNSVNIFSDLSDGIQINKDAYSEDMLKRSNVITQAIASISFDKIDLTEYADASLGNTPTKSKRSAAKVNVDISDVQTAVVEREEREGRESVSRDEEKQLKKNILNLIKNIGILAEIDNYVSDNIPAAISNIKVSGLTGEVEEAYKLKFEAIESLIREERIPVRLLNTFFTGFINNTEEGVLTF